jgi:hypothetical protein
MPFEIEPIARPDGTLLAHARQLAIFMPLER